MLRISYLEADGTTPLWTALHLRLAWLQQTRQQDQEKLAESNRATNGESQFVVLVLGHGGIFVGRLWAIST